MQFNLNHYMSFSRKLINIRGVVREDGFLHKLMHTSFVPKPTVQDRNYPIIFVISYFINECNYINCMYL